MSKGPVAGRENEERPTWRSGALRENSRVSRSRLAVVDLGVWWLLSVEMAAEVEMKLVKPAYPQGPRLLWGPPSC